MKKLLLLWSLVSLPALAGPLCIENMCLQPLDQKAAAKELAQEDAFLRAMTPYDRAMRLKTDKPVSAEEYQAFLKAQALGFTAADKRALAAAVRWVNQQLAKKKVAYGYLPKKVKVVKTTGREEGNAAYTRGSTIFLPASLVEHSTLGPLLAHELVHVLLRSVYPERRDGVYALAGFQPMRDFQLPSEVSAERVTNPDGFGFEHAAALPSGEHVVPVLLGTGPYDPARGGEFFQYIQPRLLVVERDGEKWQAKRDASGALVWRELDASFVKATNSVTGYVIHPDEIIASNFEALLTGKQSQEGSLPEALKKHFAKR